MKKTKKPAATTKASPEKKDTSPRVHQREKIDFTLNLKGLDWTEKQKAFIDLATHKDTKIIFLSGPAGTSKSILAVYSALELLNQKRISDLIYVRTIVESAAHSMGTLPGDADQKLHFFVSVLNDKLEELLPTGDIKRLHNDDRVRGMPVNYLRGASYNAKAVIVDEAQNANFSELLTSLTRIGKFTKYYILGDPMQTDLKNKEQSGFKAMYDLFNDEESKQQGIHCVEFTKDDIMRSEILKFIIDKVEQYNLSKNK
jgi:phosphate starvation-inducible protein PhoH and related proteins